MAEGNYDKRCSCVPPEEKGGAVVARLVFAVITTAIMRLGIAVVAYFVVSDDCIYADRHTFSIDELT